MSLEP